MRGASVIQAMDNPFKKRRTELITDRRTLLSFISPTPIEEFFRTDREDLIDKLTLVVGTPGCGKTTIAQVVEFESLATLCLSNANLINKDLVDVLTINGLIRDGVPAVLGHRISMTTNFRDIWELPYSEPTRTALLRAFVQSKAVLGWFRQLEGMGISLNDVEVVMGANSESVVAITKANDPLAFREYARSIELAIFRVVTSLVPPEEREMAEEFLNSSYDVFEVLRTIRVRKWPWAPNLPPTSLRPMMIIDDAHELQPTQFIHLRDWLKSKVIGTSRWLLCRPDVVSPDDYRDVLRKDVVSEEVLKPGSTRGRDYLIKLMQLGSARDKRFKPIANDISSRYIASIPEFARRGLRDLPPMLDHAPPTLPDGQLKKLHEQIDKLAKDFRFGDTLVQTLRARIPPTARPDEALAALRILMHRESNRTPQMDLLLEDSIRDEPVTDDRKAGSALIDGARIHLMHQFDRPYYYGMEKLIAASNANIEQFIRLGGSLVDEVLARIIRGKSPNLTPKAQHTKLVTQAVQTINEWDFPYNAMVRELVTKIAERCKDRTLKPNAPLDDGANAIGIPQEEMDKVLVRYERLARVLHFAFAYKALVFVPQYSCKNKVWCLLELGALPCMAHGLTLSRGGFIEDTLSGLESMLPTSGV
ncbi:hypothetical protein HMI48_00900 [Acidithiobacillus ferrooxidans]|uniref:hypothetical protein n=1 Tax=Acidithiobacillus ferrooxidans TaxID=920 RepID=UPI001C069224|nr:hypothetical protein [Acidithiobacillus ferrooxidans]MBU2772520.1 hypothetical protein [Acidithiobacillus ferrooxidans]